MRSALDIKTRESLREEALLSVGGYVRCSALRVQRDTVHVLFRNKDDDVKGYYMSTDTYHVFKLGTPATPSDFEIHGTLLEAPTRFNH